MIRLPTRLKELFRKEGAWWGFFGKYKHRMRPAIVDNVLKMLSCGLTVRGYAVFQRSNLECSPQKKVCFSCKSRFCPTCGKKLTDQKTWIIHFANSSKNHHRNIKYLSRYLKRPPLSMSRLRHHDGKAVIFSYLNHATKEYLRFSSKVEDIIKHLVQHIPDKGSRMIRYYGFLATRVRSKLLPRVYDLLDQPERKKERLFLSVSRH